MFDLCFFYVSYLIIYSVCDFTCTNDVITYSDNSYIFFIF